MPVYVFRAADGEELEELFPVSEAPSIGTVIERDEDGKVFVRVFAGLLRRKESWRAYGAKYPYASHALERWTKPTGMEMAFDKTGKPLIMNAGQESEYASRMTDAGHPMVKM